MEHLSYCKQIRRDKDTLVTQWMREPKIRNLFKTKNVPAEIFKNHFADRIIEHQLSLIEATASTHDCPVMSAALRFFRHADFYPEDIYIICSALKREMLRPLVEEHKYVAIYDTVCTIFDTSLTTLMRELRLEHVNALEQTDEHLHIKTGRKLAYNLDTITDAFDFEQLEELEERLYYLISRPVEPDTEFYDTFGFVINRYAHMLIDEAAFYDLVTAFESLSIAIDQFRSDKSEPCAPAFRTLFSAFLDELAGWRSQLLSDRLHDDSSAVTQNLVAQVQFLRECFLPQNSEAEYDCVEFF